LIPPKNLGSPTGNGFPPWGSYGEETVLHFITIDVSPGNCFPPWGSYGEETVLHFITIDVSPGNCFPPWGSFGEEIVPMASQQMFP